MITIATSRFDNDTILENISYRELHPNIKCIYGTPTPLCSKIEYRSLVYIIEMNNSENKVIGIGLVRNAPSCPYLIRPYRNMNFNRYVFTGDYRISRDEIPTNLLNILEKLLFYGKTHMKRGCGITTLSNKIMRHHVLCEIDIYSELYNAFRNKYQNA